MVLRGLSAYSDLLLLPNQAFMCAPHIDDELEGVRISIEVVPRDRLSSSGRSRFFVSVKMPFSDGCDRSHAMEAIMQRLTGAQILCESLIKEGV
ncbi:MAG: hypothetical protein EBT22_09245, partial [Chloroflexi bacterium]|nr:hypothetical protein [Chloroflexota bacterium]